MALCKISLKHIHQEILENIEADLNFIINYRTMSEIGIQSKQVWFNDADNKLCELHNIESSLHNKLIQLDSLLKEASLHIRPRPVRGGGGGDAA